MTTLTLIIGNKNYSSWSLRAWLALKATRAPFTEHLIPLYDGDWMTAIREHSPAGRVPVLEDGAITVWDSLAIGEYLAEKFPAAKLWPEDAAARAEARAVSAEMHSGFTAIRNELPMNLRKLILGIELRPDTQAEVARICSMWEGLRRRHASKGPFLFGQFSIADAMYMPVATRFRTYGIKLPAACQAYADHALATPHMQECQQAASAEPYAMAANNR